MKVLKTILGIALFWAIMLLGGGLVYLLMKLINGIAPGYFYAEWVMQIICNPVAAAIGYVILKKLSDNETVALVNSLVACVFSAVLTVVSIIAKTYTVPQLIGYILTVIFFGAVCISAFTSKGKKDEVQEVQKNN